MITVKLYLSEDCPLCHEVRLWFKELLPGFKNKIQFKEVSVGNTKGIRELPTIAIDGKVVMIGRTTKEEIEKIVKQAIEAKNESG
jgi:predicted thioredoxin/glutaredoxin